MKVLKQFSESEIFYFTSSLVGFENVFRPCQSDSMNIPYDTATQCPLLYQLHSILKHKKKWHSFFRATSQLLAEAQSPRNDRQLSWQASGDRRCQRECIFYSLSLSLTHNADFLCTHRLGCSCLCWNLLPPSGSTQGAAGLQQWDRAGQAGSLSSECYRLS